MSLDPSRRRLLGSIAAAVSVGVGAGCMGKDAPELRVRNFSGTVRTLHVRVTADSGETLLDAKYELARDEQATEEELYEDVETYTITATADGETTGNDVTVDDPDGVITHVTVRDDGTSIGRIVP